MTNVRERGHKGAATRWAGHTLTDWITVRMYRRDGPVIDALRGSKSRADFISELLKKAVDASEF